MRKAQPAPSIDRLREVLALDEDAGVFTWKVTRCNRAQAGKRAGCREGRRGYVLVRLDDRLYPAHRLVWYMLKGEWCSNIDHIDRDPSNNRLSNLRKATQAEQLRNTGINRRNTSGHRGVTWNRRESKWQAQYQLDRRNHSLGSFINLEEAAGVARSARLVAFGEFAPSYDRHGG